jgi:hypothetical protein
MSRWLALTIMLAAASPAGAQTFLACRFQGGTSLRLALDGRGLALQLPGARLWQEAELTSLRDPVMAGFPFPLPPEAGGRLVPHDSVALSLDRVTGEARLTLNRRPPVAQVAECRAAQEAAFAAAPAGDQPPNPPPPCDLAQPVATVAGSCEPTRTRF